MNRDSDLAKAFQFARAFYTYSGGPRRAVPLAAREALAKARGLIAALCRQIAKSRKARAKLAEGHAEELYFWNGEERLRAAFCEGAGLEGFPA